MTAHFDQWSVPRYSRAPMACGGCSRPRGPTFGIKTQWKPRHTLVCLILAILSVYATSQAALASDPSAVPSGARAVALEYRNTWLRAAKKNPTFYEIPGGVDIEKAQIQRGFVHFVLREPDLVRFSASDNRDPIEFSTELMYEFPILVEGLYLGSILILPRSAAADTSLNISGEYFLLGMTFPGGTLEKAIKRFTGFAPGSAPFSVVDFRGDSFTGTVLRFVETGGVRFAAVNGEAIDALSTEVGHGDLLPANRALPRIRERIHDALSK